MNKVLLLNATYEPLNICTWKRAISLMLKGKAEEIEHWNSKVNEDIYTPAIIKLNYYVAVPYKELPFSKKNILVRDNYTCQYCGKKSKELTLDHVFPKSRGGDYSWKNIVASCAKCNQLKADRTPKEANMKLLRTPFKPKNYMKFEMKKYKMENYDNWDGYVAS